jgi:hypothetical protein
MEQAGFLPALPIGAIGSCAADVYEPRQVREEATVNGPLWVPQGSLIALIGRAGRKSVFSITPILLRRGLAARQLGCMQAGVGS